MDIFKLMGVGIVAVVLITMLKQYKPEFSIMVSIGIGILIVGTVMAGIVPILDEARTMFTSSNMPSEYLEVMFKALGICFITQIACDICRDSGQSGIATKLEMAGKVGVLLVSMTLIKDVLSIATQLIQG